MSNQLIYTGKAKDIYSTEDENVIKSVYKDQATMLNGARKETIKGKGVLNNQISSLIFEKLNAAVWLLILSNVSLIQNNLTRRLQSFLWRLCFVT